MALSLVTSTLAGCDESASETAVTPTGLIAVDEQDPADIERQRKPPSPTTNLDKDDAEIHNLPAPESSGTNKALEPSPTPVSALNADATGLVVSTPTVDAVPTDGVAPEEEVAVEEDVSSESTSAVLEYPDIPEHMRKLILEYLDKTPTDTTFSADSYPRVLAIICEDDESRDYVLSLLAEDSVRSDGQVSGNYTDREIGHLSWTFPWQGGSIKLGYPTMVPKCRVEIEESENSYIWGYNWFPTLLEEPLLLMSIADKNMIWGPKQELSVPFKVPRPDGQHASLLELPSTLQIASNGDYLILAKRETFHISIYTTANLIDWDELIVPFPSPTDLHPAMFAETWLEQVVAGELGWLARATVRVSVDPYRLLPVEIAEEIDRSWGSYARYDFLSSKDGQSGVTVSWIDEESNPQETFVAWDRLNMDRDTFSHYASHLVSNKGEHESQNYSGWVWAGRWYSTGDNVRTDSWIELPYVSAKLCCDLLSTETGYLASTIPKKGGAHLFFHTGPQTLFYSLDGTTWTRLDTPEETTNYSHYEWWPTNCNESFWFIESMEEYKDKVLVKAENTYNLLNWDDADWPPPRRSWVVDPDGTNWRVLDDYECQD